MDDRLRRNLDTERRRLDDIEATLRALADGVVPEDVPAAPVSTTRLSYSELTADNDRLRGERGWHHVDLDAALGPDQKAAFDRWRTSTRVVWSNIDLAAVAVAALIGVAATWADTHVDGTVRNRVGRLRDSPVVQRWEKAGKRLPIDYMGPGFGGKAHRVRSPGHDLFRLFESTRQILDNEFRGVRWVDGVKDTVTVAGVFRGDLDTVADAVLALLQHLAADFITPMGLPMPGASLLYELDNRTLRTLIHRSYLGTSDGNGLNLRSGVLSAGLPVISTEAIIRLHVHAEAYRRTGRLELDTAQTALRSELLLASHALVGTSSIAKALARAYVLPGPKKLAAVRHVNVPVLLATAGHAASIIRDVRDRQSTTASSWDTLSGLVDQPWAPELAELLDTTDLRREYTATVQTLLREQPYGEL